MNADQRLSIAPHFADLTDPRIDRSRLHELLAIVAGADSWDVIEDFGNTKVGWLKSFRDLPNGTLSHDTFRRLFERLDPGEFPIGFHGWIETLHRATERQVVAIDGKTLRRSFDRAKGRSALYRVHAWATANHLVLGQVAVDAKSNEITAIPRLLTLLSISGAIVTIDATGCQQEIARTIRDRKANHVLALKVMIKAERFLGAKLSVETRSDLSSLENDAELVNEAARNHGGVANSPHWVLDGTFDEDRSGIKKENAPENVGRLRRLALGLLKQESTAKRCIASRGAIAGRAYASFFCTGSADFE